MNILPFTRSCVRSFHASTNLCASIKITKPTPRSWRRRLFDKTLEPYKTSPRKIYPESELCSRRRVVAETQQEHYAQPRNVEVALVRHICQLYDNHPYVAVCTRYPASMYSQKQLIGGLRLDGWKLKLFNNRVMGFVMEKRPQLANLAPLFVSATYLAFAQDPLFKELLMHLKKSRRLDLLCMVTPERILTTKEVEYFAQFSSPTDLVAETVGLTTQVMAETSGHLTAAMQQLTMNLQSRQDQLAAD